MLRDKYKEWYTVALLSAITFVAYVDRAALNLLIDPIKADLHLSEAQMGMLLGPAFAVFFAIAVVPAAWVADRANRKNLLACGLTLWSGTTIGSAFAQDYPTLFLCRSGVGIGEAVLAPVILSMIGDLFVRAKRPTPTAMYTAAGTVGGALSFVLVAALLDLAAASPDWLPQVIAQAPSWRLALFAVGLPGVPLALLLFLTVKEPVRGQFDATGDSTATISSDSKSTPKAEVAAFTSRSEAARFYIPYLLAANLVTMLSYISVSWFPTFLIREHGMSPSASGYLFGIFTLVGGIVGTLGFPIVSQIMAERGTSDSLIRMVLVFVPFSLVIFAISILAPHIAIVFVAHALFKAVNNGVASSASVVIASLGSSGYRGRLAAIHTILQMVIATAMGPLLVAMLSQYFFEGNLGPSMLAVALVSVPISYVLFWVARRPYVAAVAR